MLPQVRLQPWYPGQLGVSGSDVQRGLRWSPTSIVLFVDPDNNNASDAADGTDPENPLVTVQQAVNQLIAFQTSMAESLEGSVIVIAAQSTVSEDVLVPVTAPAWCTIMGTGNGTYNPIWDGDDADTPNLHIRQQGWRVTGIRFRPPANSSAIRLDWRLGTTDDGNFCMIDHNKFFGEWRGLYGIELYGAPFNTQILYNEFREIGSYGAGGNAFAICVTETSQANPLEDTIIGNFFFENDNHVGSIASDRAWNMSLFKDNVFQDGIMNPTALILDLRGGTQGYNIVTGNYMGGVYSNAGGYWANAATPNTCWVGNFAEPTPGTVADNGITVQVPA
jgi:hypothetical protein